jgi:hypothetical protein
LSASLKSDLAAVGVKVVQGKGNKGQRFLTLSRVNQEQKVAPQVSQTPTPVLDKEEEQPIPTTPQAPTPVKNNGATAVPTTPNSTTTPEEKKTPVAALQPGNGRVHATEGRVTVSSPPTSNTAREGDSHITDKGWNILLNACCEAGVSHLQIRQVLAEACGISTGDVGNVSLTREQVLRALRYLEQLNPR